jgi:hypothetical protein
LAVVDGVLVVIDDGGCRSPELESRPLARLTAATIATATTHPPATTAIRMPGPRALPGLTTIVCTLLRARRLSGSGRISQLGRYPGFPARP